MSIVAYYLDVDAVQLAALRASPQLVWHISEDPRFAQATMIDVDGDWESLSWLASPVKRIEKCHEKAWSEAAARDVDVKATRDAFRGWVAEAVKTLNCPAETREPDSLLTAIEGRGSEKQREPALNFGLGAARVFQPAEVRLLAVTFAGFDTAALRRKFNRKEMARFDISGIDWQDESDAVLDEALVPSFQRLSDFYQRASRLKHYVLVFYQ